MQRPIRFNLSLASTAALVLALLPLAIRPATAAEPNADSTSAPPCVWRLSPGASNRYCYCRDGSFNLEGQTIRPLEEDLSNHLGAKYRRVSRKNCLGKELPTFQAIPDSPQPQKPLKPKSDSNKTGEPQTKSDDDFLNNLLRQIRGPQ